MAAEGEFPKADGDVLYSTDVNIFNSNNISSGIDVSEQNVSDTNASKTVTGATVWLIKNTGANDVFINFGATATTNNFNLKPTEELKFQARETQLNFVCDTGLSSTLSVIGGVGAVSRYPEFLSTNVSVSSTSTEIYNDTQTYDNWLISNDGAVDVYIRFSATAVTTDYKIPAGDNLIINYNSNRLDGITSSGTTTIRVFAVGD